MSIATQYATFHLADLTFGVDVTRVQEVLTHQPMTPVPRAPDVVMGLINLRGQIVTAIDLRRRLALDQQADGVEPMNVVVRTDDGPVALLVDRIGDVLDVDPGTFEAPPQALDDAARELVLGAHKLEDRLLCVLDVDAAITVPTEPVLV